ncbi:MAG: aspartate kinase [Chitinophagaceae bacterium]
MKVFKFGGASVNSIERIKNLGDILAEYPKEQIMIIVSAIGKTTNALENVAHLFYAGNKEEAIAAYQEIKNAHLHIAKQLLRENFANAETSLNDIFTEVEWMLHDKPVRNFDYYYDQVVCSGELLSTRILSSYLEERGNSNEWIDVRDIFRTDDNFRDANIDWNYTENQLTTQIMPLFQKVNLVITQGFIGSTDENESTTLGREGSDYSAAIFANMLNAESLTIWKDVEGVMNADPKKIPEAVLLSALNYDEVIEMAYYGAQVIHPKTIKPLQNKSIPLLVKCFLDASLPGTIIHNKSLKGLPPIIVWKQEQALLHLHSKDFSFVGEKPVSELYLWLAELKMKPNLLQTGAVTLQLCIDDNPEKLEKLANKASELFDIQVEKGLSLLTIRHYTERVIEEQADQKTRVLIQQTPETVQILVRP